MILSTLLEKGTYPTLWCIPFKTLDNFYKKFGFKDVTSEKVPKAIQETLDWCEGRYPDPAVLLVRTTS